MSRSAPRDLSRYRAKRDFTRTTEPRGVGAVLPSERLRFVIQKHAARRLHYDLRLELDGVFKSWAVTRTPSLDPADKRLAVRVEDHPLEYGDFEGTIPRGEYGGGTVQLWDRGYWAPEGGVDPRKALEAGELKFVLMGERLQGRFVLVRLRHDRTGSKRENWLLIKHGKEKISAKALSRLGEDRSVASGRTMAMITAGKGRAPRPFMLAGEAARANAVWRSDRPSGRATADPPAFIAPQLARLVERPPAGSGWVHEIKLDGYRLQLSVAAGAVHLRTRKGLDWTERFATLAAEAAALPDCIIDGEVVALGADGVPRFAALQEALSTRRTQGLVFYAFDLLFAEGEDLTMRPLRERKERLRALLGRLHGAGHIRYLDHFEGRAEEVLQSACRMGLEGIVSKRIDAPYGSGRGDSWTKAKCRGGQEIVIGGWTSDRGALRSLLVGLFSDGKLRYAGRVGTGFGRAVVRELTPKLQALAQDESPFSAAISLPRDRAIHWVHPTLVAEIESAGFTADGLIRQGAFKGLREDKPAREVVAEIPRAQPATTEGRPARGTRAAARGGATSRTSRSSSRSASTSASGAGTACVIRGVTISNPDKPLWPDTGEGPVTKRELAQYLSSVGPWMIGHLAGRPCSFVRAPDGIGGQHFFQRHALAGRSQPFATLKVAGDRQAYIAVDTVEQLVAAAQIAAVELHPWNCVPGRPELAGRLVFDLDPGEQVEFTAVIGAAVELRERLEALGLVAFCKTTGGKGLHVVTPLTAASLEWPAAKSFAQTVCAQMQADSPTRYVLNMAKKVRSGRIFLDYLRNDAFATAVGPLSPRARPGAPVSMPLTWSQVRTGLDPGRFTLRTAPKLLARSAAWKDYARAERPLKQAIERLTGMHSGRRPRPATRSGPRARMGAPRP